MFRTLDEIFWIVNSLGAGHDLLAAHEQIVGVGIFGVVGIGHRVERPDGEREFVQHVEVGVVLGFHQPTQQLLVRRRQIFLVARFDAGVAQHLHALMELKLEWRLEEFERLHVVLLADGGDLVRVAVKSTQMKLRNNFFLSSLVAQSFEHLRECVADGVEHFMVVILECHLQVESDELRQMSMSVGVLGAEDGADGENAVEVGSDRHLLVQLWRLCEVRRLLEVADGENVRAAFAGGRNDLRRVNLDEALIGEDVAEELAHAGFESEDRLVGWRAEVQHAVVQARVLVHANVEAVRVVFLLGSRSIFDLQRKLRLGLRHDEDFQALHLQILLRARLDLLRHRHDICPDVHDALARDPADTT